MRTPLNIENIKQASLLRQVCVQKDLKGITLLFGSDAGKHITEQILLIDGGASAIVSGS